MMHNVFEINVDKDDYNNELCVIITLIETFVYEYSAAHIRYIHVCVTFMFIYISALKINSQFMAVFYVRKVHIKSQLSSHNTL